MSRLNIVSAGVAVCIACLPAWTQAENIKLIIQEFAPFSHTDIKNGEIQGILTEKIQEIIKRAGDTSSITSTSLARGLHATANEDNTCLFGFRRTPERENFFRWVGPLITDNWVLYGRKSDHRQLKTFEDAKPYPIGSYKNAATGLQLTEQGYKILFASQDEDNPRLLVNGRIDYWIVSELHGMVIAQQQGVYADIVRAARYKSIELNMLCNIHMDKQKIELYNKLNKDIDNDGTMEKILRKYGSK
ncbi:substrate-binding periplasmic protein [Undibacterium sp. SXout7W]|uniref:substrate-binding periplasmic protein n=1 Tax=Undibacterium sp. SXout7W TaxID=3413049 RepID=UPI003BEF8049